MNVVDASIAIKLVINEPDSAAIRLHWQTWILANESLVVPPLFRSETLSVIRRTVYRGLISQADGDRARSGLDQLGLHVLEPSDLYERAWNLASRFNRPTIYDCCYVALAEILRCDFWTADRRLANALNSLPWVRTP